MLLVPEPAVVREKLLADLERRAVAAFGAIQHADDRRELEAQRGPLREKLRASLGLDRLPPIADAGAVTTGVIERQGYRIEKLLIPTLPGLWAPGHLYLPAALEQPAPAVLLAAGHWPDEGKSHPDAQAFGINMARQGFAVLLYDPLGFGERADSRGDHDRKDLLMVGIPPQGIVQYELRRALDYLESRPEVDRERTGVSGADGGGWDALLFAALDDRVRAAVIVGEAADLRDRIRKREPRYEGDNDWVVPGMAHYANVHELLALIAPRPLLLVDAAGPIYDYGANAYASLQAGSAVSLFEEGAGPGYPQAQREAAYGWFPRWLGKGDDGQRRREPETHVEPFDSEELLAVPQGQSVSSTVALDRLLADLARSVQMPAQFQLDRLATQPLPRSTQSMGLNVGRVCRHVLQTQRGVQIPLLALRPGPLGASPSNGLLIALDDRGKDAMLEDPIIREAVDRRGWMVWIIEPRGFGELATPQATWEFETSLLLGEDYLWRQGEDVRHVLRFAKNSPSHMTALYVRGPNASLAAAYALAVADPQPEFAVLRDGLLSFGEIFQAKLAPAASPLRASDWLADEQLPPHYFARDILEAGDLPLFLQRSSAELYVIDPLSNDNALRSSLPSAALVLSVDEFIRADW